MITHVSASMAGTVRSTSVPVSTSGKHRTIPSAAIAFAACTAVAAGFILLSDRFLHWFLIPVLVGGVCVGTDAVNWLRGRLHTFDPVGIIGLFGVHFFFLAPLLNVLWEYWSILGVTHPPDWRPWLGGMAALNLAGLLIYRVVSRIAGTGQSTQRAVWHLDHRRFALVLGFALIVTGSLQILFFRERGGITGYIAAYEEAGDEAFRGLGWLMMLTESFPILALMGFVAYAHQRKAARSWIVVATVGILFLCLQFLFWAL
jgi:hypothetical protein